MGLNKPPYSTPGRAMWVFTRQSIRSDLCGPGISYIKLIFSRRDEGCLRVAGPVRIDLQKYKVPKNCGSFFPKKDTFQNGLRIHHGSQRVALPPFPTTISVDVDLTPYLCNRLCNAPHFSRPRFRPVRVAQSPQQVSCSSTEPS